MSYSKMIFPVTAKMDAMMLPCAGLVAFVLAESPAHAVRKGTVGTSFPLLLVVQPVLPICSRAGQQLSIFRGLDRVPCFGKSCFPHNCLCPSFLKTIFYFLIHLGFAFL